MIKPIKKILVVRFRQIGDAILSSCICNELKKTFPNSQVHYVVYDFIAPIFQDHHSIDRVISLDKETRDKPLKYISFIWKLMRKEKYDLVVDLMATPKSEFFTFLAFGSKFRLGKFIYSPKYWNIKKRGFTYTHAVREPDAAEKSKYFKGLELLTPLEKLGYDIKYTNDFSITFKEEELTNFKNVMAKKGVDFSEDRVAFAVNSRREEKVYPRELMQELIVKFMEKYPKKQVIFFYSDAEKDYVKKFHEDLINIDNSYEESNLMKGFSKRIFSNIETKDIRELGFLIKNCDLFIGNDGGPRHIAVALDVVSFGIFSPASVKYDWFLPGNPKHFAMDSKDFLEFHKITSDIYDTLTFDEKYRLMLPEQLLENIGNLIDVNS